MQTIRKKDLVKLGFGEYEAKDIIQRAKKMLVEQGFEFYASPKRGIVPVSTVTKILGFDPLEEDKTNRC